MGEEKKDNEVNENLQQNTGLARRSLLKLMLVVALVISPFFTFFFRRKKVNLPYVDQCEVVISKPNGIEYGIFLPDRNVDDKNVLGLSSTLCSDAEIIAVQFSEYSDDSYYIAVDLKFVSEKPDPQKEYNFELIAYDQDGSGFAYSAGKTRDIRTIDLEADAKNSPSALIREMKVRPVFSLDFVISQEQFKRLGRMSLLCSVVRA